MLLFFFSWGLLLWQGGQKMQPKLLHDSKISFLTVSSYDTSLLKWAMFNNSFTAACWSYVPHVDQNKPTTCKHPLSKQVYKGTISDNVTEYIPLQVRGCPSVNYNTGYNFKQANLSLALSRVNFPFTAICCLLRWRMGRLICTNLSWPANKKLNSNTHRRMWHHFLLWMSFHYKFCT